jgi:hypothetical protein
MSVTTSVDKYKSALNDGRLTLGDSGRMKLDMDPFPMSSDQAGMSKGKNVIVSDDLQNRMIKPRSPEVGIWKENVQRRSSAKKAPSSDMLIEMYIKQQRAGHKRQRSPTQEGRAEQLLHEEEN